MGIGWLMGRGVVLLYFLRISMKNSIFFSQFAIEHKAVIH